VQAGSRRSGVAGYRVAAVPSEGAGMVRFWRDESGQGLVEYALIIAVIAITIIVAMIFLKDQLANQFSNIGNNLT
jgi:pilus assembly protein Flp/PilA